MFRELKQPIEQFSEKELLQYVEHIVYDSTAFKQFLDYLFNPPYSELKITAIVQTQSILFEHSPDNPVVTNNLVQFEDAYAFFTINQPAKVTDFLQENLRQTNSLLANHNRERLKLLAKQGSEEVRELATHALALIYYNENHVLVPSSKARDFYVAARSLLLAPFSKSDKVKHLYAWKRCDEGASAYSDLAQWYCEAIPEARKAADPDAFFLQAAKAKSENLEKLVRKGIKKTLNVSDAWLAKKYEIKLNSVEHKSMSVESTPILKNMSFRFFAKESKSNIRRADIDQPTSSYDRALIFLYNVLTQRRDLFDSAHETFNQIKELISFYHHPLQNGDRDQSGRYAESCRETLDVIRVMAKDDLEQKLTPEGHTLTLFMILKNLPLKGDPEEVFERLKISLVTMDRSLRSLVPKLALENGESESQSLSEDFVTAILLPS